LSINCGKAHLFLKVTTPEFCSIHIFKCGRQAFILVGEIKTDPIKRALELRKTLISDGRILVADFSNTLQGKDTSKVIDLMPNVSTGEYVFRTKVNVKPIDPLAAKEYKTEYFDIREKTPEAIEAFIRKQEFDFPLWFKHDKGFDIKRVLDYNPPFIVQVAGCNFHDGSASGGCWYCFVDDASNSGYPGAGKATLGIDETINSMLSARETIRKQYAESGHDLSLKVLRTSGGEPTIVLDWILNLWRKIAKRGCDFVGQLDTNLSTASIVEQFEKKGIYEPNTLEKLAEFPVKVLTAIKGVDEHNLQENVQSTAKMADHVQSIRKFLKAGFDIYPQMYNPDPSTLKAYLEQMDSIIENFSPRIHLGPLKVYGPTKRRLELKAKRDGTDPEVVLRAMAQTWKDNYERSCAIINHHLQQNYGVSYKETTRSDVKLKIKST
jgi:pyruvate-formate lyase-activating enzyme